VEPGETLLAALRRELHEEVGLAVDDDPVHVWHQEVVAPGMQKAMTAWSTTIS
jgi:8-oxo-dGTP diphosphatase